MAVLGLHHWVFVAACRPSSCGEQGPLLAAVRGPLITVACHCSRCTGFSSCGTWAQQPYLVGSRVQAQQLRRDRKSVV